VSAPDKAFLQRLIDYGIATDYLRGRTGSAHVGIVPLQLFAKAEPPACSDFGRSSRPQRAPGGYAAIGRRKPLIAYGKKAYRERNLIELMSSRLRDSRPHRHTLRQARPKLPRHHTPCRHRYLVAQLSPDASEVVGRVEEVAQDQIKSRRFSGKMAGDMMSIRQGA